MKIIAFGPIEAEQHIKELKQFIQQLEVILQQKQFVNFQLCVLCTKFLDQATQNNLLDTFETGFTINLQYCDISQVSSVIVNMYNEKNQTIIYFQIPSLLYLQNLKLKTQDQRLQEIENLMIYSIFDRQKLLLKNLFNDNSNKIYEIYTVEEFTQQMQFSQREFHDDISTDPDQQLKLYFPNQGYDISNYPTDIIKQRGARAPIISMQIVQKLPEDNEQDQKIIADYMQRRTNCALPFSYLNLYQFCNELLQIGQYFYKLNVIYNQDESLMINGEKSEQYSTKMQLQKELTDNFITQDILKNYEIDKTVARCINRLQLAEEAMMIKEQQHQQYINNIQQIKQQLPIKLILKSQLLDFDQIKKRNKFIYEAQRGKLGVLCIVISSRTKIQLNNQLALQLLQNPQQIYILQSIILQLECLNRNIQLQDCINIDDNYKQMLDEIQQQQFKVNNINNNVIIQNQQYKIENGNWFSNSWDYVKKQIGYEQTTLEELNKIQQIQDLNLSIKQLQNYK